MKPYVVMVTTHAWYRYVHVWLSNGRMVPYGTDIFDMTDLQGLLELVPIEYEQGSVLHFASDYDEAYLDQWEPAVPDGYIGGEIVMYVHPERMH